MSIKNAFYAQSGGVTAVINASAAGVIETARQHPDKIGNVYAGRNGIIGALTEDLIDTSADSAQAIAALRHTPSGGFGSCRYKLKSIEQNRREYERLIEVFKAHNIGYFFYNGGGDSADTCLTVSSIRGRIRFWYGSPWYFWYSSTSFFSGNRYSTWYSTCMVCRSLLNALVVPGCDCCLML